MKIYIQSVSYNLAEILAKSVFCSVVRGGCITHSTLSAPTTIKNKKKIYVCLPLIKAKKNTNDAKNSSFCQCDDERKKLLKTDNIEMRSSSCCCLWVCGCWCRVGVCSLGSARMRGCLCAASLVAL